MCTMLAILSMTVLGAAACSCAAAPRHATSSTQGAAQKAPGDARVGDLTTCPVSGETFVVGESSPQITYEGKTYYFCCTGCIERFQADPAKFLSRSHD